MEDFIYIGRVATTHGVRGAMKIFPTTDDPRRFEKLKKVWLETPRGERRQLTIKSVKYFKQFVILEVNEVTTMTEAELLKQSIIMLPKSEALPCDQDEYYLSDLIEMETFLQDGRYFGKIKEILFTGSNDVYVITTPEGKEVLLPAIKQCILKVDVKEKKMTIHIMEGLMDL